MAVRVAKRRSRGNRSIHANAAPQQSAHHTLPAGSVKGTRLSWRTCCHSSTRLLQGFMKAADEAFVNHSRISDRIRKIRRVLHVFNQPNSVLTAKLRRFLERFEEPTEGDQH